MAEIGSAIDQYCDPPNASHEIDILKTFPTLREVNDRLNSLFPGWIAGFIIRFTKDYDFLTRNWDKVCREIGVARTCILSCNDKNMYEPNHTVSKAYAELFTQAGFLVRTQSQLATCSKCHMAMASKEYHESLVKHVIGEEVPLDFEWSDTCSECRQSQ